MKVVESERLFDDPAVADDLLHWLGFPPMETPFPALNASSAPTAEDEKALNDLRAFFESHKRSSSSSWAAASGTCEPAIRSSSGPASKDGRPRGIRRTGTKH